MTGRQVGSTWTLWTFTARRTGKAFVRAAASETTLEPDLIKRDLGKLLLALEQVQEERIRAKRPSRNRRTRK